MNKKEIVILLSITAIAVICWIIFDALHTHASVTISSDLQKALEPIDTSFDQATLDRISKVSDTFTPPPAASIIPTPTPAPTSSASAKVLTLPLTTPASSSSPSASVQP